MATSSISTIGRAVRDRLPEWKRSMMKPAKNSPLIIKNHQVGYFNRVLRLVGLVKCQLSFNIKIFKRK